MAVARRLNLLGQWRLDVPHVRQIESAVAYDFDSLAGGVMAGSQPQIVKGFKVVGAGIGVDPATLQLEVADSIMLHQGASFNGTVLRVPSDRDPEVLDATNDRVEGAFVANQTNYVGLDYTFDPDESTSDIVQFLDPNTQKETPKTVPVSKTLDYKIVISTTPFSAQTNICPVAIVVTDSNGIADNGSGIPNVQDARQMYFRLALGSDAPDPLNKYAWPEGRGAESIYSFSGGDKAITYEREWKQAMMNRIWEISGGEYWYSDTTDRNVRFTSTSPSTLSDNVVAAPATAPGPVTVQWEGLAIILSNSTADYNTVTDNTGAGETLLDGECLYVDVDRFTNATLTMQKGTIANLGSPTNPGSRFVLVWAKEVDGILYAYSRFGTSNEVGRELPVATESILGITTLSKQEPPIKFVSVDSQTLLVSSDGSNWFEAVPDVGTSIDRIRQAGGIYYANTDGSPLISHDLKKWEFIDIGAGTDGLEDITYSPTLGRYIIAADNGNVYHSDDLITWNTQNVGTVDDLECALWVPFLSLFIVTSRGANIYTSPDAITWTPHAHGLGSNPTRALVHNGTVVVALANDYLAYSTDGLNWNALAINTPLFTMSTATVVGTTIIISGEDGLLTPYYATSTDGFNWITAVADYSFDALQYDSDTSTYWGFVDGTGVYSASAMNGPWTLQDYNRYLAPSGDFALVTQSVNYPSAVTALAKGGVVLGKGVTRYGTAAGTLYIGNSSLDTNVAIGYRSIAVGDYSVVGGGKQNNAAADYTTVSGGYLNVASGDYSFIGGGNNNLSGSYGTVGGGDSNSAGSYGFVGGGDSNSASGVNSVVGGGHSNATGISNYAFVGGGHTNTMTGGSDYSFVGGGRSNSLAGDDSAICSGNSNTITGGRGTFIGGGTGNTITVDTSYDNSFIGGGQFNVLSYISNSVVVGGYGNSIASDPLGIAGSYNFIGGGRENEIGNASLSTFYSTIGGGYTNSITGDRSTIAGGSFNSVTGDYSTIAGGANSVVGGDYAAVLGGSGNVADGDYSAVVAGASNPSTQYGEVVLKSQDAYSKVSEFTLTKRVASVDADTYSTLYLDGTSVELDMPQNSLWIMSIEPMALRDTASSDTRAHSSTIRLVVERIGAGLPTLISGSATTVLDSGSWVDTVTFNVTVSGSTLSLRMKHLAAVAPTIDIHYFASVRIVSTHL